MFNFPQKFRWPVLAASALLAGLPLGRSLRVLVSVPEQEVSEDPDLRKGAGAMKQRMTGQSEDSDEAIETEISRLVGAPSRMAGMSPEEVISIIDSGSKENSDLKRYLAVYEAVSQLGPANLADAFRRAREANNAIALRAIERRWAEVDPLSAVKLWSEHGPDKISDAFFSSWSKMSPSAALRWLESLPEGERKASTQATILGTIARTDPQRALDFANQLGDGPDRAQLVTKAFEVLAAKNPSQALVAAKSLPEGSGRQAALDTVIARVAASNLEEAQRLIASLPSEAVLGASRDVATRMAKANPDSALNWANTLPEGPNRQSAYSAIAGTWAGKDIEGVAAWLDQLPPSASRDAAVEGFAVRTAPKDPEGSAIWAATLPPGQTRTAVLKRSLGIWQRYNPEAAAEWLSTTPGLSAEERQSLARAAQEGLDLKARKKNK